jgi:hypothetical protein
MSKNYSYFLLTNKLLKRYLLSCILLLLFSVSYAQSNLSCGDYTITRATGITYSSIISTGSTFASWRNTSGSGSTGSFDDNRSNSTNIGFDFWYLGVRYTTFCVSTNGFIDFSSSTANGKGSGAYGYDNTNFSSTTKTSLLTLAPFYDDQVIGGNVDGTDSLNNYIRYQLNGTAPNRTLVVEWSQMDAYGNTTPDLNYQVVLHETTGIIEFNYGLMTSGTNGWSYSCGMNGISMSNPATTAQLLTQQTANTATFNDSPSDALSTVPTGSTNIKFTSPTPSGNPTNLTFTSPLQTGVTLNWQDNSTNEAGYVIYYSTDNVNFYFNTQTAANATTTAVSGLIPGTTYYWNVYAVTDGCLSSVVTGSCVTNPGTLVTSVTTGNWNTTTTWDCACIPNVNDNVIVANLTIVTINANSFCNSLQVGQGTSGSLVIGSNTTGRTLAISTTLTVKSGGSFSTYALSAATHSLTIGGNISNSGTINFTGTSNCNTTFNANAYAGNVGNQTVSGTGATTTFSNITLNMGTSAGNIMEVTSSNFSAASGFLTLTNGIFKLSSTATITPFNASITISSTSGFWLNNSNAVVSATTGMSITLQGLLEISSGTMGIGLAKNDNVLCQGGNVTITGGALTIAGCLTNTDLTAITNFSMSSGTLTCASGGVPTGNASFDIQTPGSSFNQSGGVIIIQNEGSNGGYYVDMSSSSDHYSLTGGTLQVGNSLSPVATIQINTTIPVYNLTVNSSSVIAQVTSTNLIVDNDLTVTTGTFNPNSQIVNVGHNFTNNSAFTTSGTLNFNGTTAQILGGSSNTTFNNLSINNSNGTVSGVTVGKTATISGALTFNKGIFNTTASNYLIVGNAATTSGASNSSYVDGPIQKTGQQTFIFPVGTGGNYQPISMGAPTNTTDAFTAQYFHSNVYAVPSYTTNTWDATINHLSGDEYWILNRTVGTSSVAVTIGWNASSGGVTSLTSLTVAKYDATLNAWKNVGNASTTGTTTGGTITSNVVGSFSPFTLASTSSVTATNPLPIELLDFTAVPNGEKVDVKWETVTEVNNAYFTIEKSKDGISFTPFMSAIPGAGNSTSQIDYYESDYQPYSGVSYYRLKQTDINGVYKYYPMVAVTFGNQQSVCIYPNPIDNTGSLNVEVNGYKNQEVIVVLRDIQGREFLSKVLLSADDNKIFIVDDTQALIPGTYIITASSNDKIYNYKLIVK